MAKKKFEGLAEIICINLQSISIKDLLSQSVLKRLLCLHFRRHFPQFGFIILGLWQGSTSWQEKSHFQYDQEAKEKEGRGLEDPSPLLKSIFPSGLDFLLGYLPNIISFVNSTTLEIKSLIYEPLKGHSKSRLWKYSSGLCLALSTVGTAPPHIFKLLASTGAQSVSQV